MLSYLYAEISHVISLVAINLGPLPVSRKQNENAGDIFKVKPKQTQ